MECTRDMYALIAALTLTTGVAMGAGSADSFSSIGVPAADGKKYVPALTTLTPGTTAKALEGLGLRLLGPGGIGEFWACGPDAAWAAAKAAGLVTPPSRMAAKAGTLADSISSANTAPAAAHFVRFHDGVLPDRAAKALASEGVKVLDVSRTLPGMLILASPQAAQAVAELPEVRTIALAAPPMQGFDNGARFLLAADGLPSELTSIDLDGSGISVLVYDTRLPRASHEAFGGRLLALDGAGSQEHTTAVSGIIAGNGAGSIGGYYRGFAPNALIVTRKNGAAGNGYVYENLADFTSDYEDAIDNYGIVIANNSLGNRPCAIPGVPAALRGGYDDHAVAADTFVRGGARDSVILVWAVGNDRITGDGCMDYNTIMAPSTGKNMISVGSIVGNTLLSAATSGWGPTSDGRLKPELVAPGEQSGAIAGAPQGGIDASGIFSHTTVPDWTVNQGYVPSFAGTSAAAPQVAGVIALMYQAYRERFGLDAIMQSALAKAILIHGAQDISGVSTSYPGPDYQTGYGLVKADAALDLLRSSAWLEGQVDDSDSVEFEVVVPADTDELKLTLAWDDYPGESCLGMGGDCALPALVNDLDIEVVAPSAAVYYGPWILNPGSPATPAMSNEDDDPADLTPDRLNNVEQVVIEDPAAGTYTVRIKGFAVPEGPQRFALVVTPGLRPCNELASLRVDRANATPSSQVSITLRDCDLDLNSGVVDTIQVDADADVSMTSIMVTLTETGVSTGEFVGSLQLSPTSVMGALTVADGDVVTIEYQDASPVMVTLDAFVEIDGAAPSVTLADIDDAGPTTVILQLVTDEPAVVEIEAALLCGAPGRSARSATLGVYNSLIPGYEHDVVIQELNPGDEYFFTVTATDLAGNSASLSGGCADLILPQEIRFAVEEFRESGGAAGDAGPRPFDLAYSSIELRPTDVEVGLETLTVYSANRRAISQLPVDPSGGTVIFPFDPIANFDDAYEPVSFTSSKLFTLYDLEDSESFSGVYIGSNGYVTFGEGDTANLPDLDDFYEFARVSGLWTNLDPERGGTVTYKQLEDRFVISWLNVPRYLSFDSNTFQIELRFDGTIVLSWLEVGLTDTLIGIAPPCDMCASNGGLGAVPNDFLPTDFSDAQGGFGPTPPAPISRVVRTAAGAPIEIALAANDDGEPYGILQYRIVELPAAGTLKDAANGTTITSGALPYTLTSSGHKVVFIPPSSTWAGEAAFRFTADDTFPPYLPSESSMDDPIPNDGESVAGVMLVQAGERRLIRSFLVDDTFSTSGWTGFSSGKWEFGQPTGGSSQPNSNDPTSGFTGVNVIGYNLAGDYENSLAEQYLVSPAIDCTDFTGTRLRFARWLCVQMAPDDNAKLEVSNDGSDWGVAPLWKNPTGSTLLDRGWRQVEYDISSVADGESTVYFRWTMGTTDVSGRFAGWNIDDIIVDGFTDNDCPADVTGDGSVTIADLYAVLNNTGIVEQDDPTDINGDGIVDGDDIGIVTTSIGMTCP